jgi:hypothetical protein
LTILFFVFIGTFLGIAFLPVERIMQKLGRYHTFLDRTGKKLVEFVAQVREVRNRLALLLGVMVVVLAYFVLLSGVYRRFFSLTIGAEVTFWPVVVVLMSIAILSNIPISVNGIGLREQLHYLLFSGLALPKEVTVSASLLIFSNLLVASVVGYLLWLRIRLEVNKTKEATG